MATEIITTDDLREFKLELLDDIKHLLEQHNGTAPKQWLRSSEVRRLLGISPGTLQNLRINGTLPYTKVGGVILYELTEIHKMIGDHRRHNVL